MPQEASARGRQGFEDAPGALCQGDSVQLAHLCLPAWDLLCCHVATSVLGQVVTPHEAPVTHRTHKLLLSSVSSAVARQFVRPCKLFVTAVPAAGKRLLPCVGAKMSFKVGTFEVGLPAAWEIANIVPPSGKVYLRHTVLAGGDEHWGRGKGQEFGISNGHDTGWTGSRLGEGALWQDQHHSSLRHRRAHEHRLRH